MIFLQNQTHLPFVRIFRIFKNTLQFLKIHQIDTKRAVKSSLFKYDLTAVSLDWTIFQPRHTTNNLIYFTIFSANLQDYSPSFAVEVSVSEDVDVSDEELFLEAPDEEERLDEELLFFLVCEPKREFQAVA